MKDEQIAYWLESAKRDWRTAQDMAREGHNDWALFVAQLALEKLLKGLICIRTQKNPPFTHNLLKLAQLAEIGLATEQADELVQITQFNVEARYAEVKRDLYLKATPEFTRRWISICKRYFVWLESLYLVETQKS